MSALAYSNDGVVWCIRDFNTLTDKRNNQRSLRDTDYFAWSMRRGKDDNIKSDFDALIH